MTRLALSFGSMLCRIGWHKPGEYRGDNPASMNGVEAFCARCKYRLLVDSLGNWFAVDS